MQVVELFATVRLTQTSDGEPGDMDIINGRFEEDEEQEEDQYEYIPMKRYSYSREYKLATIDYFQTTWKENKDSTPKRLSLRYTSRRLKINRKQLRNWVANKEKI
jgi:hypothetical protein